MIEIMTMNINMSSKHHQQKEMKTEPKESDN